MIHACTSAAAARGRDRIAKLIDRAKAIGSAVRASAPAGHRPLRMTAALQALDDRTLSDIGVTRSSLVFAAVKDARQR